FSPDENYRGEEDQNPARQEVRFSVWYDNSSDMTQSRSLHAGETTGAWGTDTAGIAADPSNENRIWIAHTFAAKDTAGQPYKKNIVGALETTRRSAPKQSVGT